MFAIRIATSVSEGSSERNVGPQIGMSLDPCAGIAGLPWVTNSRTSRAGNAPSLRAASLVRSAGRVLRADATGPSPVPSCPWQGGQYAMKLSLPASDGLSSEGILVSAVRCPAADAMAPDQAIVAASNHETLVRMTATSLTCLSLVPALNRPRVLRSR